MLSKIKIILPALKYLAIFAAGGFTVHQLTPPPPAPEIPVAAASAGQNLQEEKKQDCGVELQRRQNPDGSVDEFFKVWANSTEKRLQDIRAEAAVTPPAPAAKESLDGLYAGGGTNTGLKGFGAAELILGAHSHEFISDGNRDHLYLYKIKVWSF